MWIFACEVCIMSSILTLSESKSRTWGDGLVGKGNCFLNMSANIWMYETWIKIGYINIYNFKALKGRWKAKTGKSWEEHEQL